MAKEIDKIIQSKTAPKSNNVLWDDGENLKINRNGKWEPTSNSKVNTVTPDWNAREGEMGCIKNRTHYMFKSKNQIQTECIQESSNPAFNKYDEYGNLIELYIPLRDYRDDIPMGYFIKYGDEEVFVKHSYGEEKFTVNFDWNYVYTFEPVYDENISEYYCLKVSILDGCYDSSTEIQIADYDFLHPIQLGEFYIPDTIARTKYVTALEARIAALEAKLNS